MHLRRKKKLPFFHVNALLVHVLELHTSARKFGIVSSHSNENSLWFSFIDDHSVIFIMITVWLKGICLWNWSQLKVFEPRAECWMIATWQIDVNFVNGCCIMYNCWLSFICNCILSSNSKKVTYESSLKLDSSLILITNLLAYKSRRPYDDDMFNSFGTWFALIAEENPWLDYDSSIQQQKDKQKNEIQFKLRIHFGSKKAIPFRLMFRKWVKCIQLKRPIRWSVYKSQ